MMQYPKKQYICLDCMLTFHINSKLGNLIRVILGGKKEIICPRPRCKGKIIMLLHVKKYRCLKCGHKFSINRKLSDNLLWLFLGKNKEIECPICKNKNIKNDRNYLPIKSLTYKKFK